MQLSDFIGDSIFIVVPMIHKTELKEVKLVGVEAGGIWIESQEAINVILQSSGASAARNTPVLFLPYHQISLALTVRPGLSLDETAFGL